MTTNTETLARHEYVKYLLEVYHEQEAQAPDSTNPDAQPSLLAQPTSRTVIRNPLCPGNHAYDGR